MITVHQLQDWAHRDNLSPVPPAGWESPAQVTQQLGKRQTDNRWQLQRPHSKSRQGAEKGHPEKKKKKTLYNTWKSVQETGYGLSTTGAEAHTAQAWEPVNPSIVGTEMQ